MLQDLPKNWLGFLKNHDLKKQLLSIEARLEEEIKLGKIIFPKREIIFRSLQLVRPDEVKVVILGQDPYHNFNQADGLAFSVSNFQSLPPSLINIFIEIENDLNIKIEKKRGFRGYSETRSIAFKFNSYCRKK